MTDYELLAELSKRLAERIEDARVEARNADRLERLLDQSTNYVADDSVFPQVVQFENGRVVRIVSDGEHLPFLDVSFVPPKEIPQRPPTPDEQAALDLLKNSDFLERLMSGELEKELE